MTISAPNPGNWLQPLSLKVYPSMLGAGGRWLAKEKRIPVPYQKKISNGSEGNFKEIIQQINANACAGIPFSDSVLNDISEKIESGLISRHDFFAAARDISNHGRTRWFLLELLSVHPDREWQVEVMETMEQSEDPWLIMGMASLIRTHKMDDDFRPRLRQAFIKQLQAPESTTHDRDKVRSSALGECLQALVSFAEESDITLVTPFALDDWELKPRICAFNALALLARKFCEAKATQDLFTDHQDTWIQLGKAFVSTWRSSSQNRSLLSAWAELMLARLGQEGAWAVDRAIESKRLIRPIRQMIIESRRRLPAKWLEERRADIDEWLGRLNACVPPRNQLPNNGH